MAKKDEKAAVKQQNGTTVDNVVEQLTKKNLVVDVADKAAESIKQDEEKRKIDALKNVIKCASYLRIRELLNVRKDRAKSKITLDILKKRQELLARLIGKSDDGTEVAEDQRITPNQFKDLSKKIDEDQRKQMSDLNSEFDKHMDELRVTYPSYWYYERYNFANQYSFQDKYLCITSKLMRLQRETVGLLGHSGLRMN